jgi:hypothetical protein
MFHTEHFRVAPVKVAGDERCLLIELIQRVPYDAAKGDTSTSNLLSHFGHFAVISVVPF